MFIIKFLIILIFIEITDSGISVNNKEIALKEKDPFDIQCISEDLKQGSPIWYKDNKLINEDDSKFKIFKSNGSLRVEKAKRIDHEGDYICAFGAQENITIFVRGEPEITPIYSDEHEKDVNSFNLRESETANLICEVLVRPEYKNDVIIFMWYRTINGIEKEIHGFTNLTQILPTQNLITHRSTIELSNVKFSDRASYKCIAKNGVANSSTTVNVRVKSKLRALWPFLGIVGEVITLYTIIFVYEKGRNKPENEDSDINDAKSGSSKMER